LIGGSSERDTSGEFGLDAGHACAAVHGGGVGVIGGGDEVFIGDDDIGRGCDTVAQRPDDALVVGVAAAVGPALVGGGAAAGVVFAGISLARKPREMDVGGLGEPLRGRKDAGIGKEIDDRHDQGERCAQPRCHHLAKHGGTIPTDKKYSSLARMKKFRGGW